MEILKHVYLVRHGETDSNFDGVYRGRESMLTELGREQARAVGARIDALAVDALIASSFPRTLETAELIAKTTGHEVEPSDLFTEWREASALRHKPQDHPLVAEILEYIHGAAKDDYRHSDEETFAELVERGAAALRFLEAHEAETLCVVTHGAFLRILFGCVVFRGDFTKRQFLQLFRNIKTANTGVSHMRYTDEKGWQFLTLNDDAHLR